LILDEDGEENISLEEFQNALQAYGHSSEKHFAADGGDYVVPFE
jgi:Ca2+-binding EF-hand superfamily protein